LKVNFHDQFLEGQAGVIPPGYSAGMTAMSSSYPTGELLGLKRMKRRLSVRSRPPLKASGRETPDAEPLADAIEHQDFEGRAAAISENEN
jgi:hypothetical protein